MVLAQSNCSSPCNTLETVEDDKEFENFNVFTYQCSVMPSSEPNADYLEVDHHNITSLYVSIEDCDWDAVSEKCKMFPDEVLTWVKSGTEGDYSFNWCVWRRLPIHEACRRLPPINVIQDLLAVYPDAVNEKTQFGELPLHLACSCGASASVVSLLLAYNPWAVAVRDSGGRTPLEITKSGGMSEESEIIMKAMEACEKRVQAGEKKVHNILNEWTRNHNEEISKLNDNAALKMKEKEDEISLLQNNALKTQEKIFEINNCITMSEKRFLEKSATEEKLMERVLNLEEDNSKLRHTVRQLVNKITKVEYERDEKQKSFEQLKEVMDTLISEINNAGMKQQETSLTSQKLEKEVAALSLRQQKLNNEIVKEADTIRLVALNASNGVNDIVKEAENKLQVGIPMPIFTPTKHSTRNSFTKQKIMKAKNEDVIKMSPIPIEKSTLLPKVGTPKVETEVDGQQSQKNEIIEKATKSDAWDTSSPQFGYFMKEVFPTSSLPPPFPNGSW